VTDTGRESGREKLLGICMEGCWAQGRHWGVVPFPAPRGDSCDGTAKEGLEVVTSQFISS